MLASSGVVYDYQWGNSSGEVLVVNRWKTLSFSAARHMGSAFIVVGLAGIIFTFQPIVTTEVGYRINNLFGSKEVVRFEQNKIDSAQAVEIEREQVRKVASDLGLPNSHFALYIPKIKAKAPIIENVNPTDQKAYLKALSEGVAHASGSVFPGMSGGTYLFAHSSDAPWSSVKYNTVFYLLRELEPRDEIYVFFLDKMYKYRVTEKHTVAAGDVSWLNRAQTGPERLILQTCWPPGTALKRLVIVAEPVFETQTSFNNIL